MAKKPKKPPVIEEEIEESEEEEIEETEEDPTPAPVPSDHKGLIVRVETLSREIDALKTQIVDAKETHRTVVFLLKTIKHHEKEQGLSIMPPGKYCGVEFSD